MASLGHNELTMRTMDTINLNVLSHTVVHPCSEFLVMLRHPSTNPPTPNTIYVWISNDSITSIFELSEIDYNNVRLNQCVMRALGYQWICYSCQIEIPHYRDVIIGSIVSLITSLTSVYSTVHSGADRRKHQSSSSLAFVWGIHRIPVNSPHKWPVTRNMFPLEDVIMGNITTTTHNQLWYFLWDCTVE